MIHENAKWIWINDSPKKNEYARFEGEFAWNGGKAIFSVCAETDYVLRVNGEVASFGQFAGYPTEKYYDDVNITAYCREGNNVYSLTVRYEGVNSATHIDDGPGVIYSLMEKDALVLASGARVLGGYDPNYIQHEVRNITGQLGLTSGMRCGEEASLVPCVGVAKTRNLKPRPVKKLSLGAPLEAVPIEGSGGLYDLGREEAGYVYLRLSAAASARVTVAYGEHIVDGGVRQRVGGRDFSLDFDVTAGEHFFVQHFVRIAGRYLEVIPTDGVEILSIGILPVLYPVTEREVSLAGMDRQIYDTCVRTLRLCMGNHYEDCPWREQALYVLDSRNQMLCGYDAFLESEYARENLIFMSKGKRWDGLLELTYPAVNTPAIPFFSLMYPVAVCEYVEHTGDAGILPLVWDTMETILRVFRARIDETGLIPEFSDPHWNFYEWSDGSDGWGRGRIEGQHSLILNCAYLYSCRHFTRLCEKTGTKFTFDENEMKTAIAENMMGEDGVFRLFSVGESIVSQLGNAMALLVGLGDDRTENAVKYGKNLIPATLSTMGFVYDALLLRGEENKDFVINDIRLKYKSMLDQGATTFWETLEGQSAFDNAGSLCHGWSALPVHYYHRLLLNKNGRGKPKGE